MGRRQQVIQESAEKLQSEGLEAIGVQVTCSKMCITTDSNGDTDAGEVKSVAYIAV